jgi:hypothetical protein
MFHHGARLFLQGDDSDGFRRGFTLGERAPDERSYSGGTLARIIDPDEEESLDRSVSGAAPRPWPVHALMRDRTLDSVEPTPHLRRLVSPHA